MEWPKRQLSKKGTKPKTVGKRLFKKGEVTDDKEQKRLGNDRMSRIEGILEIFSSKCHTLPISLLQTDLLDYYLPVTLTPTSIPLFVYSVPFTSSGGNSKRTGKLIGKISKEPKARKEI